MEAWLRRAVEENLIALVGYSADGHEILKFVGDMTAQDEPTRGIASARFPAFSRGIPDQEAETVKDRPRFV